jgi:AAA family ATP:ADP antiporter
VSENAPRKRTTPTTGLNLLDLAASPAAYVLIVQIILKKVNATEAELWDEVSLLPSNKRVDRATFEETLTALIEDKWLWKTGEGESAVYSGRLKRKNNRLHLPVDMLRKTGTFSTSAWRMLEAKAMVEADGEKATNASPTLSRVLLPARSLAEWFSGARQVLIIMLALSAINFFAVASIDVTGVSGFVETLGTKNLPWISIIEMLLGLGASAIYIRYADRMPSLRLIKSILAILVGIYAVTAGLFFLAKATHLLDGVAAIFHLQETTALLYPLLYLLRSQQIIIFPIAFWNLANSLYSMADARKIFPMIASGEMIGGLIGYTLFTEIFGHAPLFTKDNAFELLVFCGLLYLLILLVMQLRMKASDDDTNSTSESFVKNFRDGLETIRAVPLFRYLALTVALTWITLPILEYHFYTSINTAPGTETGSFQNFYSLYSIGLTLLPLLLQWRIVPMLTKHIEIRNAFIVLPVALVIGSLALNLSAGVYLAALIVLIGFTIYSSWDSPMMNTVQYLVPQERRARVGALLNNYAYAFGKIFGSLVLGLILSAGLTGEVNGYLYLTLALVASLGGLGTAIMVRLTYEKSMLSWRVARRARSASVLDKLKDL